MITEENQDGGSFEGAACGRHICVCFSAGLAFILTAVHNHVISYNIIWNGLLDYMDNQEREEA